MSAFAPQPASAQEVVAAEEEESLALKLQNPIADLISVPFQANYDGRIGRLRDGSRFTLNIQPVIPVSLNKDWNVISRTITPIVSQWIVTPNSGNQTGLGDIVQSVFFSPAKPGVAGIIWGVGPVFLLPTGTNRMLTARQFGLGPTAVALKQIGGWTLGGLANHIWSAVETSNNAPAVSASFFQPFVSYTTKDLWTFGLNTETTYDWRRRRFTIPLNATISKLVMFDKQPVSLTLGLRYYAASPDSGAHGFGARAAVVFLFPK